MKKSQNHTRVLSLALVICMICAMALTAFAAPVAEATIDNSKTATLTLYKYDLTNAEKDGIWNTGSYVTTGVYDPAVNGTFGGSSQPGDSDNVNDLGNGQTSNGYAIKGVEFSYLRVADIVQYTETNANGANEIIVLYGFDKTAAAGLMDAIGMTAEERYTAADTADLSADNYYFTSDTINANLESALAANATNVKNALENYIAPKGTAMPLTDADGKTSVSNLPLGLYLIVETKVPEMVTATVNPFFVSLPMTSVDGNNATDGGERWMYEVTLYPKNETGIPSLEKTLRENIADTGKNNGSASITDGYAHTGTASAGDVIDYQVVSTLPAITSKSTYLTQYSFVDTLSAGLTYNKGDVVVEFFTDDTCTDSIAQWNEASGKFRVSYTSTDADESVMSIDMTADGLAEINSAKTVYTAAGAVHSGYSQCTVRITYAATMDSDNSLVLGDAGNHNNVVLAWKRSNTNYWDTLVDDAHVYSYAIDLTKVFSDNAGNYANVEFVVQNATDGYYIKAELNAAEGIYYVTDHVATEAEATKFVPVISNGVPGKVIIHGVEDDTYVITEVKTDNGYTLLKDDITVVISQRESSVKCDIYASDVLGLLQNDPRYAETDIELHNIPQKHLEHFLVSASATVDGNAVTMTNDEASTNAMVPMTVVNTAGIDTPQTGELWGIVLPLVGFALLLLGCGALMFNKKKV